MARLKEKFLGLKSELQADLGIKNPMQTPKLDKIIISVGAGFAMKDNKLMQNIQQTISTIAGQNASIIFAKKSVAGFKVREDMPVGIKVTLRAARMYEFLDKLLTIALPRVKDFSGLNKNGFDGRGNFNFGLQEQLMFPEVQFDDIIQTHGMNISIATSTDSDTEAFRLLELFGVPFTKGNN